MNGITLNVYRNGSDCTNGGITSTADRIFVTGPGLETGNPNRANLPHFVVVPDVIGDGYHLEPADKPSGSVGPMCGGNFAAAFDSRFTSKYGRCALPVHDRFETPAEYAAMI